MTIPPDAATFLRATAVLVTQLEWAADRTRFGPGDLLHQAGPTHRLRRPWQALMTPGGVLCITVARLAAAACLLAAASPALAAVGFALTAVLAPTMALGTGHYDGADKMGLIVSVSGLLAALGLCFDDPWLGFAGVLLAGGQLTISYFVSGASKLAVPEWRHGRVMLEVMGSVTYGHPRAAALVRSRPAQLGLCWGLMLAEAAFPLALPAPPPLLWAALGIFLVFHILTGVVMGLNTFPWAFAAAYPAVLLLGAALRSVV